MLRPILFVWVLILVPETCLWAQDTSPGNAQGCDPRELTELLRPTDPAYAESIELPESWKIADTLSDACSGRSGNAFLRGSWGPRFTEPTVEILKPYF